tara:strand:+ start:168 stop:482 length:315 start_codon:yes stop_codon:yes gene_type:complete
MRKLQFPPNSHDSRAGAVFASSPKVFFVFNDDSSGIGAGGNNTSTHKFPSATTSYSCENAPARTAAARGNLERACARPDDVHPAHVRARSALTHARDREEIMTD